MKYFVQILLLLLPLSFAYGGVIQPHIVVFGSAEMQVIPDEIKWSLTVKTVGTIAAKVAQKHIVDVDNVLQALAGLGLEKNAVQTTNMQLKENWEYRNNSREKNGYYAFTGIQFTTDDFVTYTDYWTKVTSLANVSVAGVYFALANRTAIEDQVKILAIKQGREKAKGFAAALGAQLGSPILIEELDDGNYYSNEPMYEMAMKSDGGRRKAVSPGREVVRARVKLLFMLE